jgi:hypothetical protein
MSARVRECAWCGATEWLRWVPSAKAWTCPRFSCVRGWRSNPSDSGVSGSTEPERLKASNNPKDEAVS